MTQKACKTCHYGALENTSKNGSPPNIRQACDFLPNVRRYPTKPCVYWKEAEDLIDKPGRGDGGNQV